MILLLGDNHGHFDHIIEAVRKHRPEAIIFLGDIEAQRPLEQELAQIMGLTEVWWIPGNHDTDSVANHDNLFASALADRNLHGRVVEIAGLKVAGLGGVFRGEVWYPDRPNAPVNYESYAAYQKNSEPGRIHAAAQHRAVRRGDMAEVKARGKLLTHRSSIFYADWLDLQGQRADILVTHEAPSCHPNGFEAIDNLARAMKVKASFHGHHHDRLNYQSQWESLGFQAHGVGFCGITDHFGGMVRPGDFEEHFLETFTEREVNPAPQKTQELCFGIGGGATIILGNVPDLAPDLEHETDEVVLPEAAQILPQIAEFARAHFGDGLAQVILHGSATRPESFHPAESDLDVVILLNDGATRPDCGEYRDFSDLVTKRFPGGPWKKIDTVVCNRSSVERFRNFDMCFEGQVIRGKVFFDSGMGYAGEVLNAQDAKSEIVEKYLGQSWTWIARTSIFLDSAPWSAARSACRALHALLLRDDMDISSKPLRWDLEGLYGLALSNHPELEGIRGHIERIPKGLAHFDFLDRPDDDLVEYGAGALDNRSLVIAAAMKIVRRIERVMGFKVSRASFDRVRVRRVLRGVGQC